jgi:hypothetical protein
MVGLFKKFSRDQLAGAESLITDGLSLSPGDKLVVLCQNELSEAAACVSSVAKKKKIIVDLKHFDVATFSGDYPANFSVGNLSVPPIPTGIVLLIEWSERSTKARLALLHDLMNVKRGWRIASMPGVTLNDFPLCVSDFKDIEEKCEITFALLARSKIGTLTTPNAMGAFDILQIPIDDFRPENSTGKIAKNSWGNFPSGETFVVPNPYKAEGWVTVRGSVPKRPLEPSEWIRYQIKAGRITYDSIEASSEDLLVHFKSLCFTADGGLKDENSNALAELGIGTNASITKLTGNPIFDEKQLGTVHIAFGRNDQFNGPLVSTVHHDIVCTEATLSLKSQFSDRYCDDTSLVLEGTFNASKDDAMPALDSFPDCSEEISLITFGKTDYIFQPVEPSLSSASKMLVEYFSERENVQFVIGQGENAEIARVLLEKVPDAGVISPEVLVQSFDSGLQPLCRRIITGLLVYGVLKVQPVGS